MMAMATCEGGKIEGKVRSKSKSVGKDGRREKFNSQLAARYF